MKTTSITTPLDTPVGSTSTNPHPILEVKDLYISLPMGADRSYAVSGLSMQVNSTETVCVVGESGSGKTMLSSAILRYLPHGVKIAQGSINFMGKNLASETKAGMREIRGKKISMIFQEPTAALNPCMTIGKQIEEVYAAHESLSAKERREATLSGLEEVDIAQPLRAYDSYPHQLSGGQCQRILIAMALVLRPHLLIADEPTTALDVTTQRIILDLFMRLREKYKHSVMFITHDLAVVREVASRILVMRRGELVEEGSADDVLESPQHSYTRKLIASIPPLFPPQRAHTSADSVTEAAAVRSSSSDEDTSSPREHEEEQNSKTFAVCVDKVGHTFGRGKSVKRALDDVSFSLDRGKCLCIVGESGSGKSTLARCLTTLIKPKNGKIVILGNNLTTIDAKQLRLYRRRVQMVFQDPFNSLNPQKTVGTIIGRGMLLEGAKRSDIDQRTRALLNLVGLSEDAIHRKPTSFSGGQRQRIAIARALSLQPDVLIADESVSALDVSIQAQVLALLTQIRTTFNLTLIFITHDLRVAARISDTIAVMHQGKIVEYGSVKDIFSNPQHDYTQTLLASSPARSWKPSVAFDAKANTAQVDLDTSFV